MRILKSFNQADQEIARDHTMLADAIFNFLNQGNLYAINEIIQSFQSKDEEYQVVKAFLVKYDFDFRKHI